MKLRPEQLGEALRKGLAPVYIISGEEPQQLGEAMDAIRQAARTAGYLNRELFYADAQFDWSALLEASQTYSMFEDRRLIDVRLTGKPDKSGAAALQHYVEHIPNDAILLVSLPVKLSADDQKKTRWFQSLEQKGVSIQVWPLEGQQFIDWLDKRMSARKMLADRSGLSLIAARTEGNMLAAAQEIEKLHILYGSARIDDAMIRDAVVNSARYDVFDLAEAALQGQTSRVVRVLTGLKGEGIASAVVLWALARELRLLASIHGLVARGESTESALSKQRVWDKQKASVLKALQRLSVTKVERLLVQCALADRMIKGQAVGDDWAELLDIGLGMAGKPTPQ